MLYMDTTFFHLTMSYLADDTDHTFIITTETMDFNTMIMIINILLLFLWKWYLFFLQSQFIT